MNVLFFLAAAAGAFYLIFQKTAPSSITVKQDGGELEEIAPEQKPDVQKVEIAGVQTQESSEFAAGRPSSYDPSKNPFRSKAPEPLVDVPQVTPGAFTGSYDDLMPPAEPEDEEPLEEGGELGEDADVDSDEGNVEDNGQL